MFDYKLEWVKKSLSRKFRKGFFEGRQVYLFGVSDNTRQIIKILREFGVEPSAVFDNDKIKQGTYCSGVLVSSVDAVETVADVHKVYVVCSFYWKEMTAQLRNKGVNRENILALSHEETLMECFCHATRGKRIYNRVIKKYGNVPIFVCPYTGTGDIYLIGTFWEQFMQANHLNDYVFMVLSKACEKVARLFPIKNVCTFDKKADCDYLIRYYMLCPNKVNLTILNDSWKQVHTNPLECFRGYRGLGFTEMFRKFVFHLSDTVMPRHPVFRDAREEIGRLFDQYQLRAGCTVVLSPYSNTLADLSIDFWENLAERLQEAGFCVCTNCGGDTEPAIKGTAGVFFPLDIAPQVVEAAGYFIGIRSGFCDVVSGAKARKVILYQAGERFFNSSTYEYFSLQKMGLSKDSVEIQFVSDDDALCQKVLQVIEQGEKDEENSHNI